MPFFLNCQGLAAISQDIKTLAIKAKEGKLQPHEYQVRKFVKKLHFQQFFFSWGEVVILSLVLFNQTNPCESVLSFKHCFTSR